MLFQNKMSMTGSLMGYENNNEVNQAKCKKPLKPLPIVSSINASGVAATGKARKSRTGNGNGNGNCSTSGSGGCTGRTAKRNSCIQGHVNSLWSVWYGILAVGLQAYIGLRYAKRFAAYLSLPWPADAPPPKLELYACLVLAGTGVVLLPVLLGAAFLKLGNLANDGIKLGRHLSACSRDPPSSLLANNHDNSLANNLWRHGGPTAAFVHLCTAMCFLLPSLLMEARLIHAGFLPKDAIWRTDLDWVVIHRDRLVVSSFLNPNVNLSILTGFITPQPFVTLTPNEELDEATNDIAASTAGTTGATGIVDDAASSRIGKAVETFPDSFRTTGNGRLPPNARLSNTSPASTGNRGHPRTSSREDGPATSGKTAPTSTVETPTVTVTDTTTRIAETTMTTTTAAATTTTTVAATASTSVASSSPTAATSRSVNATPRTLRSTTDKYDAAVRRATAKTFVRNNHAKSRSKAKSFGRAASTTVRPVRGGGNMTAHSLSLTMNSLSDLDHPEKLNLEMTAAESYGPITLEYLNYAVALGVYSVRYPAVFWSCNKALGTIFSVQLVVNSAQSLLAYVGMSVLYKIQVVGPLKVLPVLRQQYRALSSSGSGGGSNGGPGSGLGATTTTTISTIFGDSYFLLNPHVTLVLFGLSSLLVLCSSMVMYFYAYGRFTAFLNQERERRVILSKENREGNGWIYFIHCTALCVFLAIAICSAPLLYDYSVVYRASLDGAILACIVATVLHLLLWLLVWICLTIKHRWTFKLRVTIGRATVRSARSVKLVTDVDLLSARDEEDGTSAPLLVVGNGRTYTIADASPKKAIMSVIQKAAIERKARAQGNADSVDGDSTADDEQIYWLRPKLRPSPTQSPNDANHGPPATEKGWLNKKLKPKVTFNDLPSTSGSRNKGKARRGGGAGDGAGGPEDDGDYATLRELPLMTSLDPADDSTSEENKLLECVNDDQVTYYASANRDLQPSEGDPSPILTPDPLSDPTSEPLTLPPPTPTRAPSTEVVTASLTTNIQVNCNGGQTPRCLRRADSGVPHEELTPRSDSSVSPPLETVVAGGNNTGVVCSNGGVGSVAGHSNGSSHSETSSSGVHSNASNASNGSCQRRATSVDDLTGDQREEPREQWRSCSLQRGMQPPTAASIAFSPPPPLPPSSISSMARPVANCQPFSSPQYANHVNASLNGNATATANANANASDALPGSGASSVSGSGSGSGSGCSAVILENSNEATVVIRRKLSRTKLTEPLNPNEEPFGRSTNMRMTSFTESNDIRVHASSATLPHYPTQPIVTYPHCSTMPLPHVSHASVAGSHMSGSSGSCGSVPRHTFVAHPPQMHSTVPSHTTLPSHHNGVRLSHPAPANNPFVKRFPPVPLHTQAWALPGHHTFPQTPQTNGKLSVAAQIRHTDRDSANFSMASSGDSDTCLPH
ncbi:transmembrane protein tincar isoform X1 [Megalopta genalis]|uniref:transmembrane protein tincar isoform X1 n=1 Tax=Megalopta genalis TaxID=115081 RepID=UPI003FD35D15